MNKLFVVLFICLVALSAVTSSWAPDPKDVEDLDTLAEEVQEMINCMKKSKAKVHTETYDAIMELEDSVDNLSRRLKRFTGLSPLEAVRL